MKFSIGYFDEDEYGRSFADALFDLRAFVGEVYFPWPGLRTCRSELKLPDAKVWLADGLRAAREAGIKLCLLVNANCYGGDSLSQKLAGQLQETFSELAAEGLTPESVTTTSPFVAHLIKTRMPATEVRASVNMRLNSLWQMEKLFDLFDGFYLFRDRNYELDFIRGLKRKLGERGKGLHLLVNSGCMTDCPGQIFHDNLVAHEEELREAVNEPGFNPYVCWRHYGKPENHADLLRNTWIRPEDIQRYEGLFDLLKLATRMHSHPVRVVRAYASGTYAGNLLDLMEPSHSPLLGPCWIDSSRFPDDWFDRRASCGHACDRCGYCDEVFQKVCVPLPGLGHGAPR